MITNDYKGAENINYTIVKYGETCYGHHTALTPAIVKINTVDSCYLDLAYLE